MRSASSLLREILQVLRDAPRQARDLSRPRMLWRQDLITCMLATWLIQGLTMDAWAHTNQTTLETVITPWHALFYGGFAVKAAWICFQIRCNIKDGRVGIGAVPVGYGVALIGMGLFFLSGVGDQIWHALFGIERDLEAFLSPTHLLLVLVVALVVLGPKRLPEAGRGLGSAIRGFKQSLSTSERGDEQRAVQTSSDPDRTPDGSPRA
jgi:TatA/E family protein of Tat protein translocase